MKNSNILKLSEEIAFLEMKAERSEECSRNDELRVITDSQRHIRGMVSRQFRNRKMELAHSARVIPASKSGQTHPSITGLTLKINSEA
jgi:mannose-1-phosphate guanylyltransferase